MLANAGANSILGWPTNAMGPFASCRYRNEWSAMLLLLKNANLEDPLVKRHLKFYRHHAELCFAEEAIMAGNLEIANFLVENDLVPKEKKRDVWMAAIHFLEGWRKK